MDTAGVVDLIERYLDAEVHRAAEREWVYDLSAAFDEVARACLRPLRFAALRGYQSRHKKTSRTQNNDDETDAFTNFLGSPSPTKTMLLPELGKDEPQADRRPSPRRHDLPKYGG